MIFTAITDKTGSGSMVIISYFSKKSILHSPINILVHGKQGI